MSSPSSRTFSAGTVGVRAVTIKDCTEPAQDWARPRQRLALRNLRGGEPQDAEEDEEDVRDHSENTLVVPDDCTTIVAAVKKACGELVRYQNLPSPNEPTYTEPQVPSLGFRI